MARHVPIAPRAGRGPLVLGHRGASADAPENTLAAFRLALEQGADGVELDVWRCGTGEVVVGHDEDTLRVAGVALRVPDAPLAELRALDVGGWKGDAFRGERMPLLAEVLEALPGAVVNVELKSRGGDLRLAGAAAKVVARAGAARRVLVSSFDWRLVVAFRLAAPDVPVGLLFDGERPWKLPLAAAIRLMGPSAVHPERTLATEERVRAWTRRGLAVNVWTVDDPAAARALAAMGAAGVITNVPARIRAALG
ncbi:MAG TPA: glycerophosphodiester phosphodiesterase family protein [Anaeromyxobacter sp.]|nr:glycerophosphodiester phosphodiesterase family protein [Anaeromyxobacter sp.]